MAHSLDLQRLLAEEPFVRALARSLCRDEAEEVAQETWLRALSSGRATVQAPRHWLASIARNVAHNLRRGRTRSAQRERAAAAPELVPSSIELMEREERRRALVVAVDRLPAPLRTVVLLRWFDGRPPRAIARELGLPVATVWDRLHRALSLLRERLDAEHGGDRKAWLLPLTVRWEAPGVGAGVWMGVVFMTTKVKTLAAAAVLVLCAAVAWWAGAAAFFSMPASSPGDPASAALDRDPGRPGSWPILPGSVTTREAVATQPSAAAGATLVVRAVYAEDRTPTVGVTLIVARSGTDPWFGAARQQTDAAGVAHFTQLAPGPVRVVAEFCQGSKTVTLQAGTTSDVEFLWLLGPDLAGVVVDAAGTPVAGAEVWHAAMASPQEIAQVATTAADGRFTLRSCGAYCILGARARGHAPAPMQFCPQQRGRHELRFVLPGQGGDVEGSVQGPDGLPMADALVRVGTGSLRGIVRMPDGMEVMPVLARTDPHGQFRAVGLAAGEHPIAVRAAGLAPWTGSCRVTAGATASLSVTLTPGVTVAGTVLGADDTRVATAELTHGPRDALVSYRTRSGPDGRFRLEGLPPGELALVASHAAHGRTVVTVRGSTGETVNCDVRLSAGLVLRGRLLFDTGEPAAQWSVDARAPAVGGEPHWQGSATTDAEGRFAIGNCPEGRLLRVATHDQAIVRRRIDPRAGELLLRVARPPTTARVVGTFVLPDGTPAANLNVSVAGGSIGATDQSGRVELRSVKPGTVRVSLGLNTARYAAFERERELGPGETWDLGIVRLTTGGMVRVRLTGAAAGASCLLCDSAGNGVATVSPTTHLSPMVPPGSYVLGVSGPSTAAVAVPVEVRPDETTEVEVPCAAGTTQELVFTTPQDWQDIARVEVRIAGGQGVDQRTSVWIGDDEQAGLQVRLLPGTYRVTAAAAGRAGTAQFTVAGGETPTVRVELR